MSSFSDLVNCGNLAIADAALKCQSVFETHEKAIVSISGGADSDVMMDVCERVRQVSPIAITYLFQDTGMEYEATRAHLDYLEDLYGVKIKRNLPDLTVPETCRRYGQPFVSKMVSSVMGGLQRNGFEWEDEPLDVLGRKYPKCKSYLKWWCNEYSTKMDNPRSIYHVRRNKWLKEFLIENPPQFSISEKCCDRSKKTPSNRYVRLSNADVVLTGVRASERGARTIHNKCIIAGNDGPDKYRPLYWLNNDDREQYIDMFGIRNSDCYEVWGFTRTGCAGCPFNKDVFEELDIAERHEPKFVKAARVVFADSYEYTRQYREFRRFKESGGQVRLFT
ncbi:MAG: phosphoadenosine phosphosulfate reductase family protein [Atopobiaceae bacterium]|nr:phosphoadenosine phosphosulfate reductase family protein [Atopobiaceae bacterium]